MTTRHFIALIFAAALFAGDAQAVGDGDGEGQKVADKTQEFNTVEGEAEKRLANKNFFGALSSLAVNAQIAQPDDVNAKVAIKHLGVGSANAKYDIIIQPGHYGRTSGKTGASGEKTTEQHLVAFIASRIADYLASKNLNFLVVPADGYDKDMSAKIFLAIHADGSASGCSGGKNSDGSPKLGASLGYAEGSDLLGMHSIGFALAASMGQDYDAFRKDNFTVDEHHYYAFHQIKASSYSGLLEVGELSCAAVEDELIQRAWLIAKNLGVALNASLEIIDEPLRVRPETFLRIAELSHHEPDRREF